MISSDLLPHSSHLLLIQSAKPSFLNKNFLYFQSIAHNAIMNFNNS